jgi:hypothetical protein
VHNRKLYTRVKARASVNNKWKNQVRSERKSKANKAAEEVHQKTRQAGPK